MTKWIIAEKHALSLTHPHREWERGDLFKTQILFCFFSVQSPPWSPLTSCLTLLPNMASEGRVTLNIGGSRFEVPRTTLARHPESLLGALAAGGENSSFEVDANGEYFFDRCVLPLIYHWTISYKCWVLAYI